jgi:hypothetical protein
MCYNVRLTNLTFQLSFCYRKESEIELVGRHVGILYFLIKYLLFTDVVCVKFIYGIVTLFFVCDV